jgi:hypothetical protein
MWRSLKDLWTAARRGEQPDIIALTYVAVDRLGPRKWWIRSRYTPGGKYERFEPFYGSHPDVLNFALELNDRLRHVDLGANPKARRRPPPPGQPAHTGHYTTCPACQTDINKHRH